MIRHNFTLARLDLASVNNVLARIGDVIRNLTQNGDLGIGGSSFGGGAGVVFIANATTIPITNPVGGGILYVENGAVKWRGSSGTVTVIAPA